MQSLKRLTRDKARRMALNIAKLPGSAKAAAAVSYATMTDWSDEETTDPLYADDHNFYKVELWTMDEQRVLRMLYAGTNLDKVRTVFASYIRIRPRARITIRQRMRVVDEWPRHETLL